MTEKGNRAIADYASKNLKPYGRLYLEINESYPTETALLLEKIGFRQVVVHSDNFEKSRFISALKE